MPHSNDAAIDVTVELANANQSYPVNTGHVDVVTEFYVTTLTGTASLEVDGMPGFGIQEGDTFSGWQAKTLAVRTTQAGSSVTIRVMGYRQSSNGQLVL